MDEAPSPRSRRVLIAGGGIAGLAAALAFARRGFSVALFERAADFTEVGAGLQLSPNATRLLARLGVLDALKPVAVRPRAVVLRSARSLAEIARVPLGEAAEARWGAPYLVAHRADLQSVLLTRARAHPEIAIRTGAAVRDLAFHARGVTISFDHEGAVREASGGLLVAADGVWSTLRARLRGDGASRFAGMRAWRAVMRREALVDAGLASALPADTVTAFLDPAAHLVAYPMRGGASVNLVAFTPARDGARSWSRETGVEDLAKATRAMAPALGVLVGGAGPWTVWPLHTVDPKGAWTDPRGLALIGDAAHAMTPFAAQGAALAIEDAVSLAELVAARPGATAAALAGYEASRRPRVLNAARRSALNRFAWHARGPVALARDLVLRARGPERLAADLDWLYGHDAERTAPE